MLEWSIIFSLAPPLPQNMQSIGHILYVHMYVQDQPSALLKFPMALGLRQWL